MIESNSNKLIWTGGAISVAILMIVGAKATMPQIMNSTGSIITDQIKNVNSYKSGNTFTENYAQSNLEYTFNGALASVVGFKDGRVQSDIMIPKYIIKDGVKYTVTAVNDSAFFKRGLTSVNFPNSLLTVGKQAFQYNAISAIMLPDSLQVIGSWAFEYNVQASQRIYIPKSVQSIGRYSFFGDDLYQVTMSRHTAYWSTIDSKNHSFARELSGTYDNSSTDYETSHVVDVGFPNIHYYD